MYPVYSTILNYPPITKSDRKYIDIITYELNDQYKLPKHGMYMLNYIIVSNVNDLEDLEITMNGNPFWKLPINLLVNISSVVKDGRTWIRVPPLLDDHMIPRFLLGYCMQHIKLTSQCAGKFDIVYTCAVPPAGDIDIGAAVKIPMLDFIDISPQLSRPPRRCYGLYIISNKPLTKIDISAEGFTFISVSGDIIDIKYLVSKRELWTSNHSQALQEVLLTHMNNIGTLGAPVGNIMPQIESYDLANTYEYLYSIDFVKNPKNMKNICSDMIIMTVPAYEHAYFKAYNHMIIYNGTATKQYM